MKPGVMHRLRREELESLRNDGFLGSGTAGRSVELQVWNCQFGQEPSLYHFVAIVRHCRADLLQRVRLWLR